MGFKGKVDKVLRWANIWFTQFRVASMENRSTTKEVGKILVIKIDAIGDFLIWLDSAKEFRKLYPGKSITLMCANACVDIAKHTGYFDEYIPCNIRKFEGDNSYQKEILKSLSEYSFDLLIQTAYSRTVHMDLLAAATPAKEKVGLVADESRTNLSRYITLPANRKKLDRIYSSLIPVSGEWLMEVERNGELIRGLGKKQFQTAMPVLPPYEASPDILPKEDYYVIFPGASTPKKMWEIEKFAKVADYVQETTGYAGYVCGSMDEAYLYREIVAYKKEGTKVVDYLGKTSLLELSEVIRHAKFVISNDTSGIHFAAATNTPSVCILGEYNYGRFLPYAYDKKQDAAYEAGVAPMVVVSANMPCRRCAVGKMTAECNACMASTGRYFCVEKITVEEVCRAIDQLKY